MTDRDLVVGASMRVLRERHRSMTAFARALAGALQRRNLSRQAIYDWERGRTRVPAAVWLAAAEVTGLSLEEALEAGRRRLTPSAEPTVDSDLKASLSTPAT